VTNNSIISNTETKKQQNKRNEDMNVWLYYKMEKGFLGSTTLLGVKCLKQTVAGSLEVEE